MIHLTQKEKDLIEVIKERRKISIDGFAHIYKCRRWRKETMMRFVSLGLVKPAHNAEFTATEKLLNLDLESPI